MDSFLYDRDIRHERVQQINADQKCRKEKDLTKIREFFCQGLYKLFIKNVS